MSEARSILLDSDPLLAAIRSRATPRIGAQLIVRKPTKPALLARFLDDVLVIVTSMLGRSQRYCTGMGDGVDSLQFLRNEVTQVLRWHHSRSTSSGRSRTQRPRLHQVASPPGGSTPSSVQSAPRLAHRWWCGRPRRCLAPAAPSRQSSRQSSLRPRGHRATKLGPADSARRSDPW